MTRSRIVLIGGALAAVLVAVVVGLVLSRDSGPDELVLGERASTTVAADGADGSADAGDGEGPSNPDSVEGVWTISADSLAGYRVVEDLVGGLKDFEAVGRTSEIDGSMTIEGTTATAAEFNVDVASITSDDGRRDGRFAGRIMNSDEFPTATFLLSAPIDFGEEGLNGDSVTVNAEGELTLRGVTNPVTFPITARLVGDEIETTGQIPVLFSDYGIDNPSNPAVSVRDEGKVEFSIVFIPE